MAQSQICGAPMLKPLNDIGKTAKFKMAGNAMHVAVVGSIILAVLMGMEKVPKKEL